MTNETDALPVTDDTLDSGPTEQELLDAVMANSPFAESAGIPLPEEEEIVQDSAEEEYEEDPEESSEDVVIDEEVEEEVEEATDEDGTEVPTQEAEVFTADDLDLDAQVEVTIDGEKMNVSFGDLLKGYQTDASISKKGRELGEARKMLEAERDQMLGEVQQLGQASAAMLMQREQNFSKQYHNLEAKIEKARQEGDTFEMSELKDKREQVQKKYWQARQQREGLQGKLAEQAEQQAYATQQQNMEYFVQNVETYLPGFDEKLAGDIHEFAVEEGLPSEVLGQIYDPAIIKFINDYRVLKQGVSKGEAKRKAVPTKKAVPVKKQKTTAQKQASKENIVKARAFREDASPEDQDNFLKQYAAKSLNL